MKIGITTFWQTQDNYGQMLQAWAMQQVLLKAGHNPYIIRYCLRKDKKLTTIKKAKIFIKSQIVYPLCKAFGWMAWAERKGILFDYMRQFDKKRQFDGFRNKHLLFSESLYDTIEHLRENPPSADVYITGSDQVWASSLKRENGQVYFLQFGLPSTKKISYAPSFGMEEYPNDEKELLKDALSQFSAISVREEQGRKICADVGVQAERVLDPTMLLRSSDYLEQFDTEKKDYSEEYAFIYCINILNSEDVHWKELTNILNEKQIKAYVTPASGYFGSREIFDGVTYNYATIPEWICLVRDARFVVTSSFHGIMFSLLFHKSFVYFPLEDAFSIANNRVEEILRDLGLTSRIWKKDSTYEKILNAPINWESVDSIIGTLRKQSFNFLLNALE